MENINIQCFSALLKNILKLKHFEEDYVKQKVKTSVECKYKIECGSGTNRTFIDFIEKPLLYEDFFMQFMIKNEPCLFGNWITENWSCCEEWTSISRKSEKVTNFTNLSTLCQNSKVPVSNCRFVFILGNHFDIIYKNRLVKIINRLMYCNQYQTLGLT